MAQPEEDTPAPPSTAKLLARYIMLGFAPFVAVLALMFAIISMARIPAMQAKISDAESKVHKLEADLKSSRLELEKLQDALQQEKTALAQGDRIHAGLTAQIVQNVTQVQARLKIHPTLEQQLGQTGAAPTVSGIVPPAGTATTAKAAEPQATDQAKVMLDAIKKFNTR